MDEPLRPRLKDVVPFLYRTAPPDPPAHCRTAATRTILGTCGHVSMNNHDIDIQDWHPARVVIQSSRREITREEEKNPRLNDGNVRVLAVVSVSECKGGRGDRYGMVNIRCARKKNERM